MPAGSINPFIYTPKHHVVVFTAQFATLNICRFWGPDSYLKEKKPTESLLFRALLFRLECSMLRQLVKVALAAAMPSSWRISNVVVRQVSGFAIIT